MNIKRKRKYRIQVYIKDEELDGWYFIKGPSEPSAKRSMFRTSMTIVSMHIAWQRCAILTAVSE